MKTAMLGAEVTMVGANDPVWGADEGFADWPGVEATVTTVYTNAEDRHVLYSVCNAAGQVINVASGFFRVTKIPKLNMEFTAADVED